MEGDLSTTKNALDQANKDLEEKEKALTNVSDTALSQSRCKDFFIKKKVKTCVYSEIVVQAESEVAALNRKVQMIEEDLERSEERSGTATTKLAEASQAADEANR